MDPIVILGISSLVGYITYYNSQKNGEKEKILSPTLYRETCNKLNKSQSIFYPVLKMYLSNINESFVLSEYSFEQLAMFITDELKVNYDTDASDEESNNSGSEKSASDDSTNNNTTDDDSSDDASDGDAPNDESDISRNASNKKNSNLSSQNNPNVKHNNKIIFYKTYNKNIQSEKTIHNENILLVDKTIKLNLSGIDTIYNVIKCDFNDFNKKWKKINDNPLKLTDGGNIVFVNKLLVTIKMKFGEKNNTIVINDKIGISERLIKIRLNNNISLLIYDKYMKKDALFNELENIEYKNRTVKLSTFDINTVADYKNVEMLNDYYNELTAKTHTSNIVTICQFKLNGNKTKKCTDKYKQQIIPDTYVFCVLYEPNQQFILHGKYVGTGTANV